MPPDVADLAPCDQALTAYDQEHAITYMRLLNADASCCTSTRIASLIGRGGPSKAISPASDGWQGMDIGTCFDTVGRDESRKKAYEFEIR